MSGLGEGKEEEGERLVDSALPDGEERGVLRLQQWRGPRAVQQLFQLGAEGEDFRKAQIFWPSSDQRPIQKGQEGLCDSP